jgi:hypothetical protein
MTAVDAAQQLGSLVAAHGPNNHLQFAGHSGSLIPVL